MKLYVYTLKDYYINKPCEIQLEILECDEKPKTYKVLNPSVCGYTSLSKNDVGIVRSGITTRVVLRERNDGLAIRLFEENQIEIIEKVKRNLKIEEKKLKQIREKGVIEV